MDMKKKVILGGSASAVPGYGVTCRRTGGKSCTACGMRENGRIERAFTVSTEEGLKNGAVEDAMGAFVETTEMSYAVAHEVVVAVSGVFE